MQEIKELLKITTKLKEKYCRFGRNFTLDGRLVGDIGEVLAAEKYDLNLLPENTPVHDGEEKNEPKRKVQIKASFKGNFQFPYGVIPNYFLSLQIDETGELTEIYNGPGKFVYDNYIVKNNLKAYKNSYYTLSKGSLMKLNSLVPKAEKI
ncbi:MAG TPA: hypothetical protein PKN32_06285 [Bacteroidales bacterium]|nr:hypothetical protein [Bacteroidales bacterium]